MKDGNKFLVDFIDTLRVLPTPQFQFLTTTSVQYLFSTKSMYKSSIIRRSEVVNNAKLSSDFFKILFYSSQESQMNDLFSVIDLSI